MCLSRILSQIHCPDALHCQFEQDVPKRRGRGANYAESAKGSDPVVVVHARFI
jgi:hypothetical protein